MLLLILALFCFLGTLPAAQTGEDSASTLPETRAEDPHSCAPCHKSIYETFIGTAHFRTSMPAEEDSILGSFEKGKNVVKTGTSTYFVLEEDGRLFLQKAFWNEGGNLFSRTEEIDIVVGSGRKGQSFLFWEDGLLYQLPISYLVGIDRWVNSPGYADGEVNFRRVIPPRCLECHANFFSLQETEKGPRYSEEYRLGIRCSNCHGSGEKHIAAYEAGERSSQESLILNPRSFTRARKFDLCSLCHSATRNPMQEPFSYQPGENLDHYLAPAPPDPDLEPDFHASQISMLSASKCYTDSTLSCSTCHNVHRTERNLAEMSAKCLFCHEPSHCGISARRPGLQIEGSCVSCHMPNRNSRVIRINRPEGVYSPAYRSHLIAIYPDVTGEFLEKIEKESDP